MRVVLPRGRLCPALWHLSFSARRLKPFFLTLRVSQRGRSGDCESPGSPLVLRRRETRQPSEFVDEMTLIVKPAGEYNSVQLMRPFAAPPHGRAETVKVR